MGEAAREQQITKRIPPTGAQEKLDTPLSAATFQPLHHHGEASKPQKEGETEKAQGVAPGELEPRQVAGAVASPRELMFEPW